MLFPKAYTRRSIVRGCAGLLSGGAFYRLSARSASALPVQFTPAAKECTSSWTYRQYTIHATVALGPIRIVSKKNVGGAAMAIERALDGESAWTAVQFVAGSWPDRLKGFNRFGATQELIREENGVVRESGYLSFMTTSRESDMKEARKAFNSQMASQMLTFARGRATDQGCAFTVEYRNVGAGWTWRNCADLLAEPGLVTGLPREQAVAGYDSRCLPTFLFTLQRALTRRVTHYESSYVHNSKVIGLRTEWKAEERRSDLRMVTCRTTENGNHSEFRLWVDSKKEEPLPERVEYRPRSFLALTLEAENSFEKPKLRPLLISRA
jgi:hypothetical protein